LGEDIQCLRPAKDENQMTDGMLINQLGREEKAELGKEGARVLNRKLVKRKSHDSYIHEKDTIGPTHTVTPSREQTYHGNKVKC
jgi:hypothetical protein